MIGGLATRFAESLELHLPETSANAPSVGQRESLRRVWHGCILLDRYVASDTLLPPAPNSSACRYVLFQLGRCLYCGKANIRPQQLATAMALGERS
jgi:hypothetical protein